ncbi:MAG TPA: hypothetical protein VG498_05575 [Terriglobales bacterium]|nr:hypothetical protein [Terriglobales bacterium]
MRTIRLGTFALLLAILIPAVANAAQACKPVVGSFEATVQPENCAGPLCTAGRVWGGIQGNYQFTMSKMVPNGEPGVPTIFFFTGHSIISLKSGDQLFGTDTGTIDLPPGKGGFASLITFTGGTGAMAGATGQIRLRGIFNPQEGTTSGDYLGEVCTAQ